MSDISYFVCHRHAS